MKHGLGALAMAGLYGALRGQIVGFTAPLLAQVPGGQYAPNIGLAALAYGVGKIMPSARRLTDTAILIEAAQVGGKLGNSFMPMASAQSALPAGTQVY